MELRHLRYFVAVAEEESFNRAAVRVGIGQPPLSQQIRSLEREIGAELFHRSPQGVSLTEAGVAFLPEARAAIAQAERAARVAQRVAKGTLGSLRLGFTGSATFHPVVPGAIRIFRRRYPEVELTVEEAGTTGLLGRLRDEHLDAAFVRAYPSEMASLRSVSLFEEPMVAVLPSEHRLAKRERVPLILFVRHPLVLFPRAEGPAFFDAILSTLRSSRFAPILGPEAPQLTSVANLVAAGLGVSVVPASLARMGVPGVVTRPFEGRPPVAPLALAFGSREPVGAARNFASLARAVAAELRKEDGA